MKYIIQPNYVGIHPASPMNTTYRPCLTIESSSDVHRIKCTRGTLCLRDMHDLFRIKWPTKHRHAYFCLTVQNSSACKL
uniref:Uncharacterized protein n=1 Tax=Arundo donax TaxID=35708 RepID=A0A0A9A5R9_ARUDO